MDMVGHYRKNGDFHVGVDFRNLFHALLGVFANGGQFGNAVLYVPKVMLAIFGTNSDKIGRTIVIMPCGTRCFPFG